jgi:ribose transport system substrate-binding protein
MEEEGMRSFSRLKLASTAVALAAATALGLAVSGMASQNRQARPASPTSGSALAPGVANAKANLAQIEKGINTWTGPMTGPKAVRGKSIVYVTHDLASPAEASIAKGVQNIAKTLGWNIKVIDGQNSLPEISSGIAQAIALKPDAIIANAIPNSLYPALVGALKAGIPVVCTATAPTPGVWKQDGCDVNIFQDYKKLGQALADWVIINSGGHMQGVLLSDKTYSIVTAKTDGIAGQFKAMGCTGCKLLLYTQTPFADAAQRVPGLTTTWVQKYGTPLYLLNPSDFFASIEIPALRTLGVKSDQVVVTGMDGNAPNYGFIRAGNSYQVMDIPIPYDYLGYQVVDNLNRLMSHAPISSPYTPIFVVDKTNVNKYGGRQGAFIPGNNYKLHFSQLWKTGKTTG